MSQNARESLSALMDSEGDDLELRRVLKTLESEPDAAEAWRRYHLMRSLLRRDHDIDVSTDLSAGIMARLEAEPAPTMETPRIAPRRSYPLARSAGIAAAVTLMVISGVQFYQGSDFTTSGGDAQLAGSEARSAATQAPRNLAAQAGSGGQATPVGMPFFSPAASGGQSGLMPVGASFDSPLFMTPNPRQSQRTDQEQARLLQSYLDRHAEGATYRSGDVWMPLLRGSGNETLGQR
ncbi:sigma-E factor negative regulatory protein [Halomonas sp. MCCC 1A17488]|uniref:Sigma-E factor negative regulatory protein n=1 Tax=Billgrantia sulfidoxydans TaxID=2733484 RepID=A0ABX7W6G2_9GAMM|nr:MULTISPECIES: sigma-E factor negative regulatory protein [Halomonas]MCE8015627.1 sigma-E factor negative regulatory protein [Halomonas sp. MCCC 1A17488]MCG3238960.1 sigma-E factor negative regulatory protein [Halomonas sp. MCCC 1A17488]QPP51087.1 sigma-E factor negative regulatory protein [Halomonas sp. SS10-MC5]QTP54598.1 sigma-E factor negative regulatory protein [Halomonas sulfidoxydans]